MRQARRTGIALALRTVLLVAMSTAHVAAQETAPPLQGTSVHPEARDAIGRLWSPYCPGLMLEVCPSPGGAMLRDSIDRMARRGLSSDSIVERILDEYGEEYRAEPLTEGVGGLAWYVPPLAFGVGLLVVAILLARRRRRGAPEPSADPTPDDERRLREAMAALDAEERPDF